MSGQEWIVNSDQTREAYKKQVDKWLEEHKYATFPKPRFGKDRSLDQNALFHVWLSQWIAYKLNKDKRMVTKSELAGIKRTMKKLAYIHLRADFLIHEIKDYSTGETKKDYTSSKDWKRGEMYQVLELMQNIAAQDGLILESKGEFKRLQDESEK